MELDHSNRSSEKTAEADNHQVVHVTWSSTTTTSDDQDSSSGHTATTRSYRCSFCQRGFSNAQALGGHMNIHRKDRARLKTTLSLDTTTKNQFSPPHPYTPLLLHAQESSSCSSVDERCSSQKRPPIIETADSDNGELQLSLSIETSSSSNELKEESNTQQVKRSMHQQQQQLKPGAPQKTELDLELRLGPDRTTN